MNRKIKYMLLAVSLLTVLAAILVSMQGRLSDGGAEPTPEPTPSVEPTPTPVPPVPPEDVTAPEPPSIEPPETMEPEETPEPETYAIVVTAGPNGEVSPRGLVSVKDGGSVSFTFTPDAGYEVAEVKVDGQDVVSPAGYVFAGVHESHTLYVIFREKPGVPEETPEPEDGEEPEETPPPGETPEPEETSAPEDTAEPAAPEPEDISLPEPTGSVTQGFFG